MVLFFCYIVSTIIGANKIIGMLTSQAEVEGVTFQRPAAPPPIVSAAKTGNHPIQPGQVLMDGQFPVCAGVQRAI